MFETLAASHAPNYAELAQQLSALLAGERNCITNSAQFSAFIFQSLSDLNWAGFYWVRGENELLLGPFQGKVACVTIPFSRGVCGASATTQRTLRVDDVYAFAGHIACDAASNSEIVIPVRVNGQLRGVFDIDSPQLARFSAADQAGLEELIALFIAATDFVD